MSFFILLFATLNIPAEFEMGSSLFSHFLCPEWTLFWWPSHKSFLRVCPCRLCKSLPVKLALVSTHLPCVLLMRRNQTQTCDTMVVLGLKDASFHDTIRRYAYIRRSGKSGCASYVSWCDGQDKQPVWQLDVVKGEGEAYQAFRHRLRGHTMCRWEFGPCGWSSLCWQNESQ